MIIGLLCFGIILTVIVCIQRRALIKTQIIAQSHFKLTQSLPGLWFFYEPSTYKFWTSHALNDLIGHCHGGVQEFESYYQLYESVQNQYPLSILKMIEENRQTARVISNDNHYHITVSHNNQIIMGALEPVSLEDQKNQEAVKQEYLVLKAMVQNAPIAMWYRDYHGHIQYCNKAYANLLKKPIQEVIQDHLELVDNKRAHSPFHVAVKAKASNTPQHESIQTLINGTKKTLDITEHPLPQYATVGFAVDMSELDLQKNYFNKNIQTYQDVLQNISSPLALFDEKAHLIFFNHAYARFFELDESWLHSGPFLGEILERQRTHRKLPEYTDFPSFKKESLHLFQTLLNPFQELMHLSNGEILRKVVAPHPLGGLIFLYEDVTDKMALERGYNTLIAVQKETIEHLYEGVAVFGTDFRLRLMNTKAHSLWDIELGSPLGIHFLELLDGVNFDNKKTKKFIKETVNQLFMKREANTGEINLKNGIRLQYGYQPLPDGGHLLSFVDITNHYHLEQALREKNQALETADRLKSDFISHVSYELRAPLNAILGFSDILSLQYFGTLNEQQLDYCKGIKESTNRLLMLINDMLDLAIMNAGQFSLRENSITLEPFLESVRSLIFNRAHDQQIEVVLDVQTDLTHFWGDEARLKQVFFNLLSNSVKFTPSGGKIILKAITPDESTLCIEVIDNGIGISANDQHRITKLFERGTRGLGQQRGVGLGLPLVQTLIEKHGGTFDLVSEEGVGTHAKCVFPLKQDQEFKPVFISKRTYIENHNDEMQSNEDKEPFTISLAS
jgi:signal transduction histidine kinase